MTRKEIRSLSNDELILRLCGLFLAGGTRVLKSSITEAKAICDELQEREVIKNAETLHKRWAERYNA